MCGIPSAEAVPTPAVCWVRFDDQYMAGETEITVAASFGRKYQRKVTLRVGHEYIVEPLNPIKRRHRGRRCRLLEFVLSERDYKTTIARVKFLDTQRVGLVDVDDLAAPLEQKS